MARGVTPRLFSLTSHSVKSKYFEFLSGGVNGNIVKVIKITPFRNQEGIYNLGFWDKNLETDGLDDKVITNNGDIDKVLSTVAFTIYEFFDEFPDALVYLSGFIDSRTRLYQINISKFIDLITKDFDVLGELENGFERYKKNDNYLEFVKKQKYACQLKL